MIYLWTNVMYLLYVVSIVIMDVWMLEMWCARCDIRIRFFIWQLQIRFSRNNRKQKLKIYGKTGERNYTVPVLILHHFGIS